MDTDLDYLDYRTISDDPLEELYITFLNGWPVDNVVVACATSGYVDVIVTMQTAYLPSIYMEDPTQEYFVRNGKGAHRKGTHPFALARAYGEVCILREIKVEDNLSLIDNINHQARNFASTQRKLRLVKK